MDAAEREFKAIADRRENPPFVRGLAMLGLADVALARRDFTGANVVWERLAADTALPQFHRDAAHRRRAEAERLQRGLPARDPTACRAQLPILPEPGAVFRVAPTGTEAADGSEDRPFRTLERARDAVRALNKSHGGSLPRGGVRIVINGGSYPVVRTLTLASEDSGTAEAPVVYQAKSGETPTFHGGVRVTGWRPITDAKRREELDPTVRDRVLEADLKALGMASWGDATALRRRTALRAAPSFPSIPSSPGLALFHTFGVDSAIRDPRAPGPQIGFVRRNRHRQGGAT
jgi:hypothetical protein